MAVSARSASSSAKLPEAAVLPLSISKETLLPPSKSAVSPNAEESSPAV
jgi:hypothetical protein